MLEFIGRSIEGHPQPIFVDGDGEWSTRAAEFIFADGSHHLGYVLICDRNSGEHYGTMILHNGKGIFQEQKQFATCLGKTKEQIFPYKYRYAGRIKNDHHVDQETGWSLD